MCDLSKFSTENINNFCQILNPQHNISDKKEEVTKEAFFLYKLTRGDLSIRKQIKDEVNKELSKIAKKSCYDESKKPPSDAKKVGKINDVLFLTKLLGMGAFGTAYLGTVNPSVLTLDSKPYPIGVVVKFSAIPPSSWEYFTKVKEDATSIYKAMKVPRDSSSLEIMNHLLMNFILDQKHYTPHLVYLYDWYVCVKGCDNIIIKKNVKNPVTKKFNIEQKKLPPKTNCFVMALEKFDGDLQTMVLADLKKLNHKIFTQELFYVMTLQIFYTLHCIRKIFALDHKDTGFRNIFYKYNPLGRIPNAYIEYEFDKNTKFYIPDTGYTFYLGDYGLMSSRRLYAGSSISNGDIELPAIKDPTDPNKVYRLGLDRNYKVFVTGTNDKDLKYNKKLTTPFYNKIQRESYGHIGESLLINEIFMRADYIHGRKFSDWITSDEGKKESGCNDTTFIMPPSFDMMCTKNFDRIAVVKKLIELSGFGKVPPNGATILAKYTSTKEPDFDIDEVAYNIFNSVSF